MRLQLLTETNMRAMAAITTMRNVLSMGYLSARDDRVINLDGRRPDDDHENGREDEHDQREHQLHGKLRGQFLRLVVALDPHGVGMHPKGLGHTRSEAVRL